MVHLTDQLGIADGECVKRTVRHDDGVIDATRLVCRVHSGRDRRVRAAPSAKDGRSVVVAAIARRDWLPHYGRASVIGTPVRVAYEMASAMMRPASRSPAPVGKRQTRCGHGGSASRDARRLDRRAQ